MDDSVGGHHVGGADVCALHGDAVLEAERELGSANRLHLGAVMQLPDIGGGDLAGDHVEEEDCLQLLLVLQQGLEVMGGNLCEGRVGRREDGKFFASIISMKTQ